MKVFEQGLKFPVKGQLKVTEYGTTIIKTVALKGIEANGAIEVSYFYLDSNLSAVPEVVSILPKIYR